MSKLSFTCCKSYSQEINLFSLLLHEASGRVTCSLVTPSLNETVYLLLFYKDTIKIYKRFYIRVMLKQLLILCSLIGLVLHLSYKVALKRT